MKTFYEEVRDDRRAMMVFTVKILGAVLAFAVGLGMILSSMGSIGQKFQAERNQAAFKTGQQAQRAGLSDASNPYYRGGSESLEWFRGYIDAKMGKAERE